MIYEQTKKDLREMIALLARDGRENWARFFKTALTLLHAGEARACARHIRSRSGGMGSLNDLVLGQGRDADGNFRWKVGYQEMNERYQTLLERLYEFSHSVQRAAEP